MKNPDLLKGKTVIKAWDGKYYVGVIVQVPYLYNKKAENIIELNIMTMILRNTLLLKFCGLLSVKLLVYSLYFVR